MHKLVWSERAQAQVKEIRRKIAERSPKTAKEYVGRLTSVPQSLRRFPESGAIAEDWSEGEREIYFGIYRIVYVFDATTISIVRVIHGSRLRDNIADD